MTLVPLPATGTGSGCVAVVTGVSGGNPSGTSPRGSTSPVSEASPRSFWLGTAPAGRLFVPTRGKGRTGGAWGGFSRAGGRGGKTPPPPRWLSRRRGRERLAAGRAGGRRKTGSAADPRPPAEGGPRGPETAGQRGRRRRPLPCGGQPVEGRAGRRAWPAESGLPSRAG